MLVVCRMNIEEFASTVAQPKLLPESDLIDIFIYMAVQPKPMLRFSSVPRTFHSGREELRVYRFTKAETRWSFSVGNPDKIWYLLLLSDSLLHFSISLFRKSLWLNYEL